MTTRCADVDALIERRLDGTAAAADEARLDAHLAACPDCAALLAEEAAIDAALAARFAGAAPPAGFDGAVRARLRDEPRETGGWIPDALNAVGILLVMVAVVPAAVGLGGVTAIAVTTVALAAAVYPLMLMAVAGDAGVRRA
jgi:predicted anti-sigma-YlaC factor YlaD